VTVNLESSFFLPGGMLTGSDAGRAEVHCGMSRIHCLTMCAIEKFDQFLRDDTEKYLFVFLLQHLISICR